MNIDSFSNITNPVFSHESGYYINITCDIEGVGTGLVFTAYDADPEPYGHQLYTNALNEVYGPVAPYVAPAPEEITPAILLSRNQQQQGRLLQEASIIAFALQSAVDLNIATAEQVQLLIEIKEYAAKLLNIDLTQSPMIWPQQPN